VDDLDSPRRMLNREFKQNDNSFYFGNNISKKKKWFEKNEIEFLVNEIKKLCPMAVNRLRNKDKTMS
jgi:hypothetical protein